MVNTIGPGPLIAIDVFFLYIILGPLVLFAIYVLFDFLAQLNLAQLNNDQFNNIGQNRGGGTRKTQSTLTDKKDSALLSDEDVELDIQVFYR